MHSATRILFLTIGLTAWAAAVPKKAPISKYTTLWTNSPFTSKPPPPEAGPVVNPLDDYALAGVSPISGGYRVTLLNKKKPEERITVDTGDSKSDFKILAVTRKSGDPLGTIVRMSNGASTGTVSFDEKLLVLAAAPAAPRTAPNLLPGVKPAQLQPGQVPPRQPRPRVVPPPTTQAAQAAQQGKQAQPPTQNQRPDRRGGR